VANHPETEKLIRRYFDAMRRKNYDAVWACYCEDIVYEDVALGHVYKGLDLMVQLGLAPSPA
jgi:ketosteroid isomerase-like protein